MTIKVYLDPSQSPAVTVNPETDHVNQGNQTITWVPGDNQNFTFSDLQIPSNSYPGPNPFGTPNKTDSEITVTDNNPGHNGNPVTYEYIIYVSSGGVIYHSGANNIAAGAGNPAIKNN